MFRIYSYTDITDYHFSYFLLLKHVNTQSSYLLYATVLVIDYEHDIVAHMLL